MYTLFTSYHNLNCKKHNNKNNKKNVCNDNLGKRRKYQMIMTIQKSLIKFTFYFITSPIWNILHTMHAYLCKDKTLITICICNMRIFCCMLATIKELGYDDGDVVVLMCISNKF